MNLHKKIIMGAIIAATISISITSVAYAIEFDNSENDIKIELKDELTISETVSVSTPINVVDSITMSDSVTVEHYK